MLSVENHGDVAVVKLDDGKANVVSEAFSQAINEGLDAAEKTAAAVVLVGRPGRFCAGFDLSVIRDGTPEGAAAMRTAGARAMHRLFLHPQPVVIACSGHAVAAGALILLTGDTRIGMRGKFTIGLNETAIGLALPVWGLELAKARMPVPQLTRNVIQAQLHDPDSAVEAGYLDQVVEPDALMPTAIEKAGELAKLDGTAYGEVKRRLRGQAAQIMLDSIS
ncbi:MAG: crotonase/enoyl-CoA hydratase family protein [Chromatiales bacterium]|jgi:enoyl-CoA hydratase|nr:crotonase/enoyl-CoA hydratase family protein [Chromatiales bacterium]